MPTTRGRVRLPGISFVKTVYPAVPPAGMTAWYKANAIVGLNDDDLIATWPDSSGNAYDMLQADDALKPKYKVNIINGQPTVRFATDYVTCGNAFSIGNNFTILFVCTLANTTTRQTIFGQENTASSFNFIDFPGEVDGSFSIGNTVSASTVPVANPVLGMAYLISIVKNGSGTTQTYYQSGMQLTPNTNASYNFTADGAKGLGRRAAGTQSFSGDLAEIIIYTSTLSSADRLSGERYLAGKYNIRMYVA